METRIVIDLETATPPYEQVQRQITSLIAVGQLNPGTRLPTVRSLAADLGVAAGTVARAYKELEAAGLVVTNRRQGTVVSDAAPWSRQARAADAQARPADEARPADGVGSRQDPPTQGAGAADVMAAVDHLIAAGETAGLDGKMLITLLQGRLNQRGQ